MRKIVLSLLLAFLLVSSASADGFIHIYDEDMWRMQAETQQYCAINYYDGIQHMILAIDVAKNAPGEHMVWIFPVPAPPEETSINIIKGFPKFTGYDVIDSAGSSLRAIYITLASTQFIGFMVLNMAGSDGSMSAGRQEGILGNGVDVHQSVVAMGLSTELVSAFNSESLEQYLSLKELFLEPPSRNIINEYIGEDYSFVITWISDMDAFRAEQGNEEYQYYADGEAKNTIGVVVNFPTEKMYFPLKPTSVYGDRTVPAVIYVLGNVEPELYSGIEESTDVTYFYSVRHSVNPELESFYTGQNMDKYTYLQGETGKEKLTITARNLEYTKIKIDAPSHQFTKDLWMHEGTPANIQLAGWYTQYIWVLAILLWLLTSMLASFVSSCIVFKKTLIPRWKFFLVGLANLLTVTGFAILTYFLKTKETVKGSIENNFSFTVKDNNIRNTIFFFVVLLLLWILIGRNRMEEVLLFLFPVTILIILIFIIHLSERRIEHTVGAKDVHLFDLKRTVFLLPFNLILSLGLIFLSVSNSTFNSVSGKLLGFYQTTTSGLTNTHDGNTEYFLFLLIFVLSLAILYFLDKFTTKKWKYRWLILVRTDWKKLWFVLLFSVLFLIILAIITFLLGLIV